MAARTVVLAFACMHLAAAELGAPITLPPTKEEPVTLEVHPCRQPKEPGPCKGSFPRWYHNIKTRECEEFVYGGCGGNDNNFQSQADCSNKCSVAPKCCPAEKEPGKFGNPICFEGHACCPTTGEWTCSIGDGKTFVCDGARTTGPFGKACPCGPCPQIKCAAPPAGCKYGKPTINDCGCQTDCGELICREPCPAESEGAHVKMCMNEEIVVCGTIQGLQCKGGLMCFDDPRDNCDPANGGSDCAGVCCEPYEAPNPVDIKACLLDTPVQSCGGIAGLGCGDGRRCFDDPRDNCDPTNGGADCPGICCCGSDPVHCPDPHKQKAFCEQGGGTWFEDECRCEKATSCPDPHKQKALCEQSGDRWNEESCDCQCVKTCGPVTQVCKGGRDATGKKCNCKPFPGCADCERTGDVVKCLACEPDRWSVDGKCPKRVECKGGSTPAGDRCKCNSPKTCHRCMVTLDGTASDCEVCKKNTYLHEGKCLAACPEGFAHITKGTSSFGGSCQLPFTCAKGKVVGEGHPREGKACRCANKQCQHCTFAAAASGPDTECFRCTSKLYLWDGDCVAHGKCPLGATYHGLKKAGRDCRKPFVCDKGMIDAGDCECHKRCTECNWEADNAEKAHVCTKCKGKKQPVDGACP